MIIDQIIKDNIQTYNLDYILIDDFAIDFATEQNFKKAQESNNDLNNDELEEQFSSSIKNAEA